MADNIISKAVEKATAITDKISDFTDDIWGDEERDIKEEFRESGKEKIKSVLEYINNSTELIKKSGFELKGLGIALSLSPVIISSFGFNEKITPEAREPIFTEAGDSKLLKIIFHCLFKASDFFDAIKFSDYKLDTVNITLGLTPGINMTFKK